ncbi:mucin-2 [Colossoma macropomum]|uniref:mucin-2 n=1 Tax=Colossoma macropomum TaxID=42526 RepID=UPI0018651971|nr:mucin-2 [Colossoma macropomum]
MRLFVCRLLFIFTTGNFLSGVRGDCGGKTDVLEERNGSIRYSFPAGLQSNNLTFDEALNDTIDEWPNVTCTWIINAWENQTVWIDVVHVDADTSLWIKYGNKTVVKEKGALFTGSGRTTVEWSWRNGTKASRKFHLRWNTSEDGRDIAQVPYTHSDNDPVSPSPDAPNRVTRAPDILGFGSASSSVHTLRGMSVQLGGGVSGSDDKSGPPIPQEGTHNGQEKAGAAISDLAHTVTNSRTDTHTQSTLSYTHVVTRTAPTLALSSARTKLTQLSAHTSTGHYDIAMATRAYLNRESDNAYTVTVTQTQSLTKKSPAVDPDEQTATKIYPDLHNGTEGALLNSTVLMASSHTVRPAESVTDNEASVTVPEVEGLSSVTKSDVSMTTSIDEGISMVTPNRPYATTLANTPNNRALGTEIDQSSRSSRSTRPNQDISNQTPTSGFDDSNTASGTPAVVAHNQTTFSHQESTSHSEASESPLLRTFTTSREDGEETPVAEHHPHTPFETNTSVGPTTRPTPTVHTLDSDSPHISHTTTFTQLTSLTSLPSSTDQPGSTNARNHDTNVSSTFAPFMPTTPSDLPQSSATSVEGLTDKGRNSTTTLASRSPNTVRQDTTFASSSILPLIMTTAQVEPTVTPDLTVQGAATTEEALRNTSEEDSDTATSYTESPLGTQSFTEKTLPHTLSPHISPTHITDINTAIPQSTDFPQTEHSGNEISHPNSSQSGISSGPMIPVSISPSISSETGSMEATHSVTDRPAWTDRNDPVTPTTSSPVISLSSAISTAGNAVSSSTPSQWTKSKTPAVNSPLMTTQGAKITPTPNSNRLTTSKSVLQTHVPTEPTYQSQTASQTPSTASFSQTSQLHPFTQKTDKDWSHKGRVFVVEDQPATIKVETFQVLLQVILEGESPSYVGLVEVEPFLHRVAGYQSQQVTWHSGPVLQTVVTFRTVETLSWLGRVESLLHEAGLSPLPIEGIFVNGIRVKNITVGGLHTDVCSWLFMCPSGFQCVSSEGNASCRSLCHTEYCKHHGICVHRPGQQPLCQCPVGEDFWFMGQRCDLRMTRQRLVGVCFGVLLAVALLMAILSYLAVRRFKSMLIQAKVDQTRSSYRRFNHFDELSARFWGRSWPGSEDSLDNPAFTRSDEILHMRALDRTCCYHDDTLSIASTYQDSASHLNTVYPHSSQYHWDLSNYSLADCVVDSGKASDLSVCSWPIEPIQWTPFPLLQQLSRNTASVKASRPRSYCEGMELVDLEKSWTA